MISEAVQRTIEPIEPVAISALGACTCFGGVTAAAAAARAGLVRAVDLTGWSYVDDTTRESTPLAGVPCSGITDGFEGAGRLIRMSSLAAEDLAATADWLNPRRTLCFLALPAPRNPTDTGRGERETATASRVASHVARGVGIPFNAVHCYISERNGTARVLGEARDSVRKGRCDHAIVGVCDSWLDPSRLGELISAGRLKTRNNPVGLMPGEAAAFLLLERMELTRARGWTPEGLLIDFWEDIEESSSSSGHPPAGRALGRVVLAALGRVGVPAVRGTLYLDLNGEPSRAVEWGSALARIRTDPRLDGWAHEVLAASFGDTGAASTLLGACLAARAFSRRYAAGERALVLSSDNGPARLVMALMDPRAGST